MDGGSASGSGIRRQSHCCGCRAGCPAACWAEFRTSGPCGSRTRVKGLRPEAVFKKNRTPLREGACGAGARALAGVALAGIVVAGGALAGRLPGLTTRGAGAEAGPCAGLDPLPAGWAPAPGPTARMPPSWARTCVAGVPGDELAADRGAAGRGPTRATSTEGSRGRPAGSGAGAGSCDSRGPLARCGRTLLPRELCPELEGSLVAGGASWTPLPSADG